MNRNNKKYKKSTNVNISIFANMLKVIIVIVCVLNDSELRCIQKVNILLLSLHEFISTVKPANSNTGCF